MIALNATAAPFALEHVVRPQTRSEVPVSWRNRVEISYRSLRNNVQAVKRHIGDKALIAVVKADAYGLGLERCSRIYHEAGADAVAVAALTEADRVRRAVPGARIMILGSPIPDERPAVVASGYEVWVSSREEVLEFAHLGKPGAPARLHLAVDTGMGRAGCSPLEAVSLAQLIMDNQGCELAGLATHYPEALDAACASTQESLFEQVLQQLPDISPDCWIHRANSEGVLCRPGGPCNAVRVGLLLTGCADAALPDIGLQTALRWLSAINLVKQLPAGHSISYNQTVTLERPTRIALVPVGYADGYPIRCSNRSQVLIQGCRCPLLGRVTMDYLIVDTTDLVRPPVPGDPVVLLGSMEEEHMSVDELAHHADTIPYDILCGLRGRCEIVGVP